MNTETLTRNTLTAISLIGLIVACSWRCWLIALGFLTALAWLAWDSLEDDMDDMEEE